MKRFYQSVSAGALLLCGSISFTTSIDVITDQRAKFWENSVSSLFYFMSKADMDGAEDYYGTGYDFSLGTTYKAMEDLKIGCSVNYTVTGAKESYYESDTQIVTASANPPLDFVFISGGATYNVTPAIDVTGSLAWIHYLPEDVTTAAGFKVKYEKEAYVIALEAGYKI